MCWVWFMNPPKPSLRLVPPGACGTAQGSGQCAMNGWKSPKALPSTHSAKNMRNCSGIRAMCHEWLEIPQSPPFDTFRKEHAELLRDPGCVLGMVYESPKALPSTRFAKACETAQVSGQCAMNGWKSPKALTINDRVRLYQRESPSVYQAWSPVFTKDSRPMFTTHSRPVFTIVAKSLLSQNDSQNCSQSSNQALTRVPHVGFHFLFFFQNILPK